MKEKIIEALGKLDVNNDNHWTNEGLPKLEALKFSVGSNVTRDQVNEVAPGYTREHPFFIETGNVEPAQVAETKQPEVANEAADNAETVEGEEAGKVPQAVEKRISTLTVNVDAKMMLSGLFEELPVVFDGLDTEALLQIEELYKVSMQAEQNLMDEVNRFISKRAEAYNELCEAIAKSQPKSKLHDQLSAFREAMKNSETLPINRPRQVIRQGHGPYSK